MFVCFFASDCNHTWESGLQDANQPLCAFNARWDGEPREGNVDLSAALPTVFLPMAVHSHIGLAYLKHSGQEEDTEFQSWAGVYVLLLIESHVGEAVIRRV